MKLISSRNAWTILLLDSDPLTRAVVCEALEHAGYYVMTAGNLSAAVARLDNIEPDLLMITPYIDSMPGRTAADYLRRVHPGVPVLMMAGSMDDCRVTTENELRGFHSFPRPFGKASLLAAVSAALKYEWEKRFVFYAPIGPVDGEFLERLGDE